MPSAQTIAIALASGILPALLWLWFWLKEDRLHPEPRGLLSRAFIYGMIVVVVAFFAEKYSEGFLVKNYPFSPFLGEMVILSWVVIEELLKYFAAYRAALRKPANDEPVDALIYLITTALGFAALENSLFLLSAITDTGLTNGLITGNFRFIGATLLHILASSTIGLAIAWSFYRKAWLKKISVTLGVIGAIVLHLLFNLFIMNNATKSILLTFGAVWAAIIVLLVAFEKVKSLQAPKKNYYGQ